MQISEYVSLGHPDKIADYISEYILDRLIEQDPKTRYALEVQIKDNNVTIAGEITTQATNIDYDQWIRQAIENIGYTPEYCDKWGKNNTIDPRKLIIVKYISQQSPDIAQGVNTDAWGDQGIMFGLATNTPEKMPKDYYIAKKLCVALYTMAKEKTENWGLDIKTQITLDDANKIQQVIVAAPVKDNETKLRLQNTVEKIITDLDDQSSTPQYIINGTGAFVKHASHGDCGTTGRKLAVDFYGGNCKIGGGSPWTKDGTKADLALNLYAREYAVNTLKKYNKEKVIVGIGCCIGKPEIEITAWDQTGNIIEQKTEVCRPSNLIKRYDLDQPVFAQMCKNGLFSIIDQME